MDAYRNTTWVTQIDGVLAEDAAAPVTGGTPTSSSTLPGLVLWMIEQARVSAGSRVLITGAGTGLSTAYVCEIAGEGRTTAIETDPAVTERAREALAEAGYAPTPVTGDGLRGHAGRAPYDVVLAFCSMRHVPYGLLRQVEEGAPCSSRWPGGAAVMAWCCSPPTGKAERPGGSCPVTPRS